MQVQVFTFLKPGVKSPEGAALLARAQHELSGAFVSMRKGSFFELEIDTNDPAEARTIASEAASKLLANPTIEEFEVLLPAPKAVSWPEKAADHRTKPKTRGG